MYSPDRFYTMNYALLVIMHHDEMFSNKRSATHLKARDHILDYYHQLDAPEKCEVETWGILVGVVAQQLVHIEVMQINLWRWVKDASSVMSNEFVQRSQDTLEYLIERREIAISVLHGIDSKIQEKKDHHVPS